MKKPWSVPWQSELEGMDDCYALNFQPLDLEPYANDRNLEFYKLQNNLLENYKQTKKVDLKILWKMYPFIEGVTSSLAKKRICTGISVPNFEDKVKDAALLVFNHYQEFPYYRAKKLENVVWSKITEVFLNKNLQLNERTRSFDAILERRQNKEEEQIERLEQNDSFLGSDYNPQP